MSGAPEAAGSPAPPARTPIGALFEAAFRRYGASLLGYTLWSLAVAAIPAAVGIALRDADGAIFAFFAAQCLAHLLLCGVLTGLVTGGLRARLAHLAVAGVAGAALLGGVFAVAGPFAIAVYPLVAFAPIAAAAGDASGIGALPAGAIVALRDWGRAYGVLIGLVMIAGTLWFGFFLALTPVGGDAHQLATLTLTTLVFSPLAALVQRNLYGDSTGRTVVPASVSIDQVDRGKRRRRR